VNAWINPVAGAVYRPESPDRSCRSGAFAAIAPGAALLQLDNYNNKELLLDPQRWNQSIEAHETTSHDDAAAVSRYRVWSPFHSEWAANGFARRLVLATDVPVEVVNESPGNYQVVFSYRDDGERQALVERIETVTGLELE